MDCSYELSVPLNSKVTVHFDRIALSGNDVLEVDVSSQFPEGKAKSARFSAHSFDNPLPFPGQCLTCSDIYSHYGERADGVYTLYLLDGTGYLPVPALCDMTHGGYTVFQQRTTGSVEFNRTWAKYAAGFGVVGVSGEFWMGNDALHLLSTQCGPTILHIDLPDAYVYLANCPSSTTYEDYTNFQVGSEAESYKLSFSDHSGTAGDGLCPDGAGNGCLNGVAFSTLDRDNSGSNCPHYRGDGGWWYYGSSCDYAQLNAAPVTACNWDVTRNVWYSLPPGSSRWRKLLPRGTAMKVIHGGSP